VQGRDVITRAVIACGSMGVAWGVAGGAGLIHWRNNRYIVVAVPELFSGVQGEKKKQSTKRNGRSPYLGTGKMKK